LNNQSHRIVLLCYAMPSEAHAFCRVINTTHVPRDRPSRSKTRLRLLLLALQSALWRLKPCFRSCHILIL
jgi:hypothetical protein